MCLCVRSHVHAWVYYGFIIRLFFAVFMPEAMSTNRGSVTVRAPRVKCVGVCFSSCVWLFVFVYVFESVCVRARVDCGIDRGPAAWV